MDTGRVLALSDGVFAIASTLLVLELKVPEQDIAEDSELRHLLRELLGTSLLGYVISYLLIGMLWFGHHRLFRSMNQITFGVARLNLLMLGLITLLPFSTSLITRQGHNGSAVAVYSGNIGAVFVLQAVIGFLVIRSGHIIPKPAESSMVRFVWRPGATAAVFLITTVLAPIIGQKAMWCWVLMWPANWIRKYVMKRAARPARTR